MCELLATAQFDRVGTNHALCEREQKIRCRTTKERERERLRWIESDRNREQHQPVCNNDVTKWIFVNDKQTRSQITNTAPSLTAQQQVSATGRVAALRNHVSLLVVVVVVVSSSSSTIDRTISCFLPSCVKTSINRSISKSQSESSRNVRQYEQSEDAAIGERRVVVVVVVVVRHFALRIVQRVVLFVLWFVQRLCLQKHRALYARIELSFEKKQKHNRNASVVMRRACIRVLFT